MRMKKSLLLWMSFLVYGRVQAQEAEDRGVEFTVSAGAGIVGYEERVSISPTKSDWDATAGTLRLEGLLTRYELDLYGEIRLTGSDTDIEQWRRDGLLIQENDLTYTGSHLRFGVQVPWKDTDGLRVTPRFGGVAAFEDYERDDFLVLGPGGRLLNLDQTITESVFTLGPSVGISVWKRLGESWSVDLDTEVAWIGFSEAENDGFDVDIEGSGGWKWTGEAALLFDLVRENQYMGISASMLIQELEGDILEAGDAVLEWPENTLEKIMVEIYWTGRF